VAEHLASMCMSKALEKKGHGPNDN
jgi:hypothetical protein